MNLKRLSTATLASLIFLAGASSATAALPLSVGKDKLPSLAPMIKQAAPAVVNIKVSATVNSPAMNRFQDPFFQQFFGRPPAPRETSAAGSGVIVDAKNGYILTNHHVVEGATSITVTLFDERAMEATIVGSDAGSDVALIQVDGANLSQIPLADSDELEVGDFVVAIGNPFSFSNTVTSGIVSGLGRYGLNGAYEDFIQTDAAINPGNSGGALLNLRGELIGINTAIVTRTGGNVGLGFAIPINMAQSIMSQLLDYGEVRRGLLGVEIWDVARLGTEMREYLKLDSEEGAIVMSVSPDSAAEKAGIEMEDVIVKVNDEKTRDAGELRRSIGLLSPGDKAKIDLIRKGKARTLTARLGSTGDLAAARPSNEPDGTLHPALEGASFADLDGPSRRNGSVGVMVAEVTGNSPAAARDLRAGDIITNVNRKPVRNLASFRKMASEDVEQLMLTVVRDGTSRLLFIS
ncbi:MAG: Do family serine endopeptidase [Gammaproteobacteria bacterium]